MTPMFGHADGKQQVSPDHWRQTLEAEIDRLDSLPVAELAAEVMMTAFAAADPEDGYITVGGGNAHAGPSVYHIISRLMDARGISFPDSPMKDQKLQERALRLVAEGLQELEHASLVRAQLHSPPQGGPDWVITRRGRAALDRGQVADILNPASA
jgi:hypothetical protein